MAEASSSNSNQGETDQALQGGLKELHEGSAEGTTQAERLSRIRCPSCGEQAGEVIHAAKNERRGWYCVSCQYFETAIRRERML